MQAPWMWGQLDLATLHHRVSQADGNIPRASPSPANEVQVSPCELGGSGAISHQQQGLQPGGCSALATPGPILVPGSDPLHISEASSLCSTCSHVLHHVAPCTLSKQHQLYTKTQPALNRPKPGQFSGHFPAAGSCSSEAGVNRAPPEHK